MIHCLRIFGAAPGLLAALGYPCAEASAQPVIAQFELKTLENAPGRYEFQSQNAWSRGQPARQIEVQGSEVLFDENEVIRQRHAVELEMALAPAVKARVGVEFEKERIESPAAVDEANAWEDLELTELGAEVIAILAPRESDGAGLGLVLEIEAPTEEEEPRNLFLGAILEHQSGPWFAAAVPMLVRAFGGESEEGASDHKWDFAYAAQLSYALTPNWTLALEGYGTVERLGDTGQRSEAARTFGDADQHRAGVLVYYERALNSPPVRTFELAQAASEQEESGVMLTVGLGVLEGLNENTPDHTLKLSVEVEF